VLGQLEYFFQRLTGLARRLVKNKALTIMLASLILMGLFARVLYLGQLPPGLWLDEASHGLDATSVFMGKAHPIFFPGNCGHEPMYTYIVAGFLRVLGSTIFTLRLPAALIGALAVLALAIYVHFAFGDPFLTILATGFFAFNRWHIQFSRFSLRGILVPLFAVLVAIFVERAIQKPTWQRFTVLGIILGASFYTYLSARMIPIIALMTFIFHYRQIQPNLKAISVRLIYMYCLAIAIMTPLLLYYEAHINTITARTKMISIFSSPGNPWKNIIDNVWIYMKMLQFHGDNVIRHNIPGQPMLNILMAVLFGLGVIIIFIKHTPNQLSLLTSIALFMIPGVLSTRGPASLRVLAITPFICIVSALPISYFFKKQPGVRLSITLLAIAISGSIDLYDYAYVWPKRINQLDKSQDPVFGQDQGEVALGEWVRGFHKENPSYRIFLSPQLFYHSTVQYMLFGSLPLEVADVQTMRVAPEHNALVCLNLIPRNAWWMRDSPDKAYVIWWPLMYGTSYGEINSIRTRNYPPGTNFMSITDQLLLDNLKERFPLGRLIDFDWFSIYLAPAQNSIVQSYAER
jgi:hypothetical protein